MVPSRFYIGIFLFFMAALLVGFLFFLTGMNESSYLVSDGVHYGIHFIDKPRHDYQVQGIIFTLTFLAAAILMLILIALPSQQSIAARAQDSAPPQPRRRPTAQPAPTAQPTPQPAAQPAPAVQPPPQAVSEAGMEVAQAAAAQGGTVALEDMSAAAGDSASPITKAPSERSAPVESIEQQLMTETHEDNLADVPDGRYDNTGEEDVVYGSGRVTDDSVWDFIHNYPDSAVKFLYRKTLENKPLTPTEEDIYRRWEIRGMSRTKIRKFLLEVMGWQSLPDDYPHNIWKSLRDQIFEIKSRVHT